MRSGVQSAGPRELRVIGMTHAEFDDISRKRIPMGPILASLILVAAGIVFLYGRSDNATGPSGGFDEGVLRVASWDLSGIAGEGNGAEASAAIEDAGSVLARSRANLIALWGLTERDQAKRIAAVLGADWGVVAVARSTAASGFLAVLAEPRLPVTTRTLVPMAGPSQSLAVTVTTSRGRVVRLIVSDPDERPPAKRLGATESVLQWANARAADVTVIVGSLTLGIGDRRSNAGSVRRSHEMQTLLQRFRVPTGIDMRDGSARGANVFLVAPPALVTGQVVPMSNPRVDGVNQAPAYVDIRMP